MNDATILETELLNALRELDAAVRSRANVSPRPNLLPIFQKIDSLAASLPASTDPQLRHYLQKKSYEKAICWLEGRADIPAGSCDRERAK
jgi:hypothetical protein